MKMKLTITKLVRGRRTGSILVLVCALLVLLALIGTAYLSTTRIDRSSTQQHTVNTESDMLLDGVCNMVQGAVVGGLFDTSIPPVYRAANSTTYLHYDSALEENHDGWMANRIPKWNGSAPYWSAISWPLIQQAGGAFQFDRPDTGAVVLLAGSKKAHTFQPTVISFGTPAKNYPALTDYGANTTFMAADADGDGIADAGLFKIPGGTINGVTYYAGVRVIDNNSAVNVNTAWDRNFEYSLTGSALPVPYYCFFPSSVGLYDLLITPGELSNLFNYRSNNNAISGALKDDGTAAGFNFLSLGDAFYMQLGRRLDNPGMVTATTKFRSVSLSEQAALGYGFCLRNPQASRSILETNLPSSVYAGTSTIPYTNPTTWFTDNFGKYVDTAGALPKSIRSFLTVRSPVSNLIPTKPLPTGNTGMPAYSTTPCKTSINTASFAELWRGFYNVMVDGAVRWDVPTGTWVTVTTPAVPTGTDTRMFRQPLRTAAAGTMTSLQVLQLRAAMAAVNAETMRSGNSDSIGHKIEIPADGAAPKYQAIVNGCAPQAFITEVVVDFSTAASNNVFVAVELFNPYPVPLSISLNNCKIGKMNHVGGVTTLADLGYSFPGGTTIPAGGRLVLTTDSTTPTPADITITGPTLQVPGLEQMIGNELVLMRPRSAAGTVAAGDGYNETNFLDLMPFDQISFKSITPPASGTADRWQYIRPNGTGWNFVYGGGFDGTGGQTFVNKAGTAISSLGIADATGTITTNFVIEWSPSNWAGTVTAQYPFGEFSRNGDILNVPFMGSYMIRDAAGTAVIEANSVSADSFYAEDADATPAENGIEQVGRFCPLTGVDPTYAGTDYYTWASRLFDYLTVQNPNDDYLPNKYGGAAADAVANVNPLVKNSEGTNPAGMNEDAVPVEGLVNINTASWKVLSILPLVVDGSGNVDIPNTEALAQAIVADRDAKGPFKTIFDLNRVPGFQTPPGFADDDKHGDLLPLTGVNDFKPKFLQVTRLSNLITTRSDSFTCYVVVQGWRNVGLPTATMVSQRRMMMIVDRSNVTATNKDPKVVKMLMN